jgi:hypothetical protein
VFAPLTVVALISGAPTISAAAARLTYVSSTGNDANPCTLVLPCRTLQHAVSVTKAGGEVRVIDSGDRGRVAIDKSITISGGGATVFHPIVINAPGAVVTLRGLVLNGDFSAPERNGITIASAATVHIERCTIHGFDESGIEIETPRESDVDVFVTDSTVRDNGFVGLRVTSAPGARLTIETSHFDANGGGLQLDDGGEAVIDHSSVSGNRVGISLALAQATVTSTVMANNSIAGIGLRTKADLTLESSVLRGNGTGLDLDAADATSSARISNSVVTQNTTGITNGLHGTVFTRRNNTVSGNGTDVVGTLTPLGGV